MVEEVIDGILGYSNEGKKSRRRRGRRKRRGIAFSKPRTRSSIYLPQRTYPIVSNTAAASAAQRFYLFFFFPPFFGFITHARSTGPLASFTFLRASIIVRGGVAFDTDTFYYTARHSFSSISFLRSLVSPLSPFPHHRFIVSTYFNFFFPLRRTNLDSSIEKRYLYAQTIFFPSPPRSPLTSPVILGN